MKRCALILVVAMAACSADHGQGAAPRPQAWPRIALPDSAFTAVPDLPVALLANAEARVTRADSKQPGVDIAYPALNATVYVSVIRSADPAEVWQARQQRIDTNLGGTPAITRRVASAHGFSGFVVTTTSVSQTPVQLLAADSSGCIVSATAFMHTPTPASAYDSIAPVYRALSRDLTVMLQSLK